MNKFLIGLDHPGDRLGFKPQAGEEASLLKQAEQRGLAACFSRLGVLAAWGFNPRLGFPMPVAIFLALFLTLFGVSTVLAQQPTPPSDNDVNAVAHELYCPVCENISLDVCDTTACFQWRELIRQKLAQGWSKQQIEDYFAQQYGDRVLAEPPRRGLNWLAYLIPPLAFLGGVWIVYRVLMNMRRPPAPAAGPVETGADPYVQQVEEELKKRE